VVPVDSGDAEWHDVNHGGSICVSLAENIWVPPAELEMRVLTPILVPYVVISAVEPGGSWPTRG